MATVLILGATSDMAIAIAKKYAAEKYNVQLAARNVENLTAVQSDIAIRFNVMVTAHRFDAANAADHSRFFNQLSPIPDTTVCVFGYLGDNEKAIHDWEEASTIIQTNYTGAVSILNLVAQHYGRNQHGTIIGISSVAGERGRQSNYIYGSAKAGFTAYLSGLRNRYIRDKVHVLTVLPGFVYTRMTEELNLPKLLTAQPADVAKAVYNAAQGKQNVVYVKWFWRWIMLIIKLIPEPVFKKLKL